MFVLLAIRYTNVGQLGGLTGRPVFVNNPPFDTLVRDLRAACVCVAVWLSLFGCVAVAAVH